MVVASRRLMMHLPTREIEVAIRILLPVEHDGSWSCSYEIDWPNGTRSRAAAGFDSVQALLLALQLIGTEIYTSDYHGRGQLRWLEPDQGYGFPVPKNVRDLLVGDDRDL